MALFRIERIAALVHIASLTVSPMRIEPLSRLFLAGDHAEEGGLAGAVGADDADDPAGRQVEGQPLEQQTVAVGLGHVVASMTTSPRRGPGGM